MDLTLKTIGIATAAGAIASVAYYALGAFTALGFVKKRSKRKRAEEANTNGLPPVSILKPLKGLDPDLWENLCSHCELDYPEFEIVFGASDAGDPAIELVRKLQRIFPKRQIQLVICDQVLGTNGKVSSLVQMLKAAQHPILVVNDSDIRVRPDYLARIVQPLTEPGTGLVTCLYRGVAESTLGSKFESLGISTDFVPGVLAGTFLEGGLKFAFGSTLCFRRSDLEEIGGFEALVDYLADDYELGRRMAALGKRVELSDTVVETFLPAYTLREFFEHQIRWSRTIRDRRPGGYLGLPVTFGLFWSALTVALTDGAAWAWVLLAICVTARLSVAFIYSKWVLDDSESLRNSYLLPIRDFIAPLVWALGFAGNRITWRCEVFRLKAGKLSRSPRELAAAKAVKLGRANAASGIEEL